MLRALLAFVLLATQAGAQTLRIGTQSPFVIDPHQVFLGPDMAVARMVFDSFVGRDGESNWVPGLALSWSAPDDRTWVFKLRPGVVFSDGTPFTAEDVLFSIDRVRTLTTAASYVTNLRSIVAVEAPDPLTVRITTDRPNAVLPGQLTNIFVVSAKAVRGAPLADVQNGTAAIGTGPFRVVSFSRGEGIELVRNPRYWGPKPAWEVVRERVITNDAARVAALLAGDLDMIDVVAPSYVGRLQQAPGITLFRHASDRVMFLQPNVRPNSMALLTDSLGNPLQANPLRDVKVRQALSLAIDRRALAARAFEGEAIPATQLVPEGFGGYDGSLPVLPYDPVQAKRLLADAGYPLGFGMTIACTNNRYVADEKVCQVLGQMLERAGLRMKVETLPGSVLFPRARPDNNEYPLILAGQSNSASRDPTHVISLALHGMDGSGNGTSNRGGFSDAGLDAAIDAAVSRRDAGRQEGLHAAMMQGIALGAAIPLYVQTVVVAARQGIEYAPRMDEQTVAQAARPTGR